MDAKKPVTIWRKSLTLSPLIPRRRLNKTSGYNKAHPVINIAGMKTYMATRYVNC